MEKCQKFSHVVEMLLVTIPISSITIITYEFYFKQLIQMVEIFSNGIIEENPHLTNGLDKTSSHLLITKYSYNPIILK